MNVKHPDSGQVVTTDKDHLHIYLTQGWLVVSPRKKRQT